MQDSISKLCGKLVQTELQDEFKPLAAELQRAIRQRIDSVRQDVAHIAILDRILDLDAPASEAAKESRT
jgi:hypothetical protein